MRITIRRPTGLSTYIELINICDYDINMYILQTHTHTLKVCSLHGAHIFTPGSTYVNKPHQFAGSCFDNVCGASIARASIRFFTYGKYLSFACETTIHTLYFAFIVLYRFIAVWLNYLINCHIYVYSSYRQAIFRKYPANITHSQEEPIKYVLSADNERTIIIIIRMSDNIIAVQLVATKLALQ